jgi:Zinc-binding
MSDSSTSSLSSDPNGGYICKICGLAFVTEQALAAHIDSEHPESQHAEVF